MARRSITISFDTDAPNDVVQEVAGIMETQLEFLSDGDIVRTESGELVTNPFGLDEEFESVQHTCDNVTVEIK